MMREIVVIRRSVRTVITPVILAGGSGTRLWPLSCKSFPKQFSSFGGDHSLLQDTALRLMGAGLRRPIVLTSEEFRFVVTEQLGEIGCLPEQVFIEPDGRDTAPAVLLGALAAHRADPNGMVLIAPSDHTISDDIAFRAIVERAVPAANAGAVVTFGITPDRPETGYGYLELADADGDDTRPLRRFVEKPDLDTAKTMLKQGGFLWNAGIFLFKTQTILDAYAEHAADLIEPVTCALAAAQRDLRFKRLDAGPWRGARKISFDYAIMENLSDLRVMPMDCNWSDLGDWEAVRRSDADPDGVNTTGTATAIDCQNSLLWSTNESQELVGLGLENIVAIAMPDAVLVADRSRSQEVRVVVNALIEKGAKQAETFTRDHRPWGWFESLVTGPRFQVKRIVVHPGGKLSLQSHVHRAEHWVVVEGTAHVTVGDTEQMVCENQSIYVPQGDVHRLENRGKLELTLIEVQTGAYLGEDDIIRHEDVYRRG
jgi:mannose-1-phosphate guanylyltransferase/mannose-6-phosphate isomerase